MKTFGIILLIVLTIFAIGAGAMLKLASPEHEHAYGEWTTKTPATCTEAGVEHRVCECNEEETRAIAATGHSYESVVTEPTCTAGGYTTYTCACGDSYVADETDAAGHSYDTDVTEPTCTAGGYTTYTCACGDSYVADETAKLDHNMVAVNDDTHHWTACSNNCGEATEKVAHSASAITVSYNGLAMQYVVAEAKDFTVTGTCACGKEFAVTEGIEVVNGTLVLGENTVTVKVGDASADVIINAVKFNKVVNGAIVADTYVKSGNEETKNLSFGDAKELYIYNTGMYRVFFRFNFSDVLNSEYYAEYGDEAVVKFTFTVTNGVDLTGLPVTFKSYLTSDIRSSVDFSKLTWNNYDEADYTLAWGNDENPNNTVSLLAKETVGNRATYADGKLVITVTLRELDGCIDENGNAIFVLLTTQSTVKPYIASMENEEFDIPAVQVIFSEDHTHAFIEKVVEDKYFVSANCTEKAKYYMSCSCGEAGTKTFEHGGVIEHSYGDWQTRTEATCTDAEVEFRKCACGAEETQTGDAALNHNMETKFDETNHWTECSRCDEATEPVAHFGGEATETEQATCEGCEQKYGGLASHVHQFGDWQTRTEATCTDAEVEFRKCACGVEETQTGDAALNHNMETKFDADNHWTKCSRCDEATEPVAHFGGEATETEKAVCEGCNQSYGELKPAEKKEYAINGSVVYDTDINSSTKTKDRSQNAQIYLYSNDARGVVAINLKDIINSEDFETFKSEGKFYITFTIAGNESDVNNTRFLLQVANPTYTDKDGFTQYTASISASAINWNSIHTEDGEYYDALFLGKMHYIVGNSSSGKLLTQTDKVVYTAGAEGEAGTISYVLTYDDIKDYICMDKDSEYYGQVVFKLRAKNKDSAITGASKTLYYASSETTTPPTVKFVYEK